MRCWPWFAGCAVFAWALRLRLSVVEAVCGWPERGSGFFLCDDQLAGRRPGRTPAGRNWMQIRGQVQASSTPAPQTLTDTACRCRRSGAAASTSSFSSCCRLPTWSRM